MMKYKSRTPKRTKVWSNSHIISRLDLGSITRSDMNASTVKTVDRWVSGGKKKWKANQHLKQTQSLSRT